MIERPCICGHKMHAGNCQQPTRSRYSSGTCPCTEGIATLHRGDVIEVKDQLTGEWSVRTVSGPAASPREFWAKGGCFRYSDHGRTWRWPVEGSPK